MTTFELFPLTDCGPMESPSMSSAADFPARTSALPGTKWESMENGPGYGSSTPELLASFDPVSSSWKTSQICWLEGLATFSGRWPRSGMTRNGIAYQLPTWVYHKPATGSGLLPTLVGGDARGGRNGTTKGRHPKDGMTMTDWLWLNVGRGRLHPESAEWMMGYPTGWTDCEP